MRIDRLWYLCDDDTIRPIVRAEALGAPGTWEPVNFLIDTGADSTVFCAGDREVLGLPAKQVDAQLSGIGGLSKAEVIDVQFRLRQPGKIPVSFRGQFLAATNSQSLEMSVLGRDVLSLFAVVVDRPQDIVCLLSQRHRYVIVEQ